jgi:hypothetical protein
MSEDLSETILNTILIGDPGANTHELHSRLTIGRDQILSSEVGRVIDLK